ncbi:MAG TPA: hypothetical protein VN914_17930, partial [Polyangia bacterium]|nr:hypothetical protein [Polyangia bacterium]
MLSAGAPVVGPVGYGWYGSVGGGVVGVGGGASTGCVGAAVVVCWSAGGAGWSARAGADNDIPAIQHPATII